MCDKEDKIAPHLASQEWLTVYWQRKDVDFNINTLVGVIHKDDAHEFDKSEREAECSTFEEYKEYLRKFVAKKGRGFVKEDKKPKITAYQIQDKTVRIKSDGRFCTNASVVLPDGTEIVGVIKATVEINVKGDMFNKAELICLGTPVDVKVDPSRVTVKELRLGKVVGEYVLVPKIASYTVGDVLKSCEEKTKKWIQYGLDFGEMSSFDPIDVALAGWIENAHELKDQVYELADKKSLVGKKVVIHDDTYSDGEKAVVIEDGLDTTLIKLRVEKGNAEYWCKRENVEVLKEYNLSGITVEKNRGMDKSIKILLVNLASMQLAKDFKCEVDDSKLDDRMIGIKVTATDGNRKFDKRYFVSFDKVKYLKIKMFADLKKDIIQDFHAWKKGFQV